MGELLTKWTIRLALACYVAYLAGSLTTRHNAWPRLARWMWTAGCGLFVLHVACAFQFFHHWSHVAAWDSTARETKALLGIAFGHGIYFSYLFLVLWVLDVVWLWTRPGHSLAIALPHGLRETVFGSFLRPFVLAAERTPWPRIGVHLYLFFIAVNGAIVFEAGPTRWVGLIVVPLLGVLAAVRAYNATAAPSIAPRSDILSTRPGDSPTTS